MKRKKLSDIESYLHCSIIGTCLTAKDARDLLQESSAEDVSGYSDYAVHSLIINETKSLSRLANRINKKLDCKHIIDIHRTNKLESEESLLEYWDHYFKSGNIPGAYWALMSHPNCSLDFKKQIFGEVHMLSHSVNENEITSRQRVKKLELELSSERESFKEYRDKNSRIYKENRELKLEVKSQHEELEIMTIKYKELLKQEDSNITIFTSSVHKRLEISEQRNIYLEDKVEKLKEDLLALQEYNTILSKLKDKFVKPENRENEVEEEIYEDLNEQMVLLVGGRPAMVPHCKEIVQNMNGKFNYHDGGREQSALTLRSLALKADIIICALDCVSHDATRCVKKICGGADQKIIMLKKSGLSTFTRELRKTV